MTRVAGVIGWPIAHSRSPALHNAAFRAAGVDAIYHAFAVPEGSAPAALEGARAFGFLGLNVTVPHKRAALAACDQIELVAERTGSVNTVIVTAERGLLGTNTDVEGFRRSLDEKLAELATAPPARAIVLGSGGAAASVVAALRDAGTRVSVVARDPERARRLVDVGAEELLPWTTQALERAFRAVDLLVDATSTGLDAARENAFPAPLPLEALPRAALVCSLIYHRDPALLQAARARGNPTLDGAGMLVHQAAAAFTRFTGLAAPVEAMRAALR